ncbi:enoyl-CoA hydratase 2, peroxisomal [Gossypium hirsutum]|uniref:Enoyl-CoA hydratase 2, peroxisomal n=1 Tax=Gossypium hirsutum TaxID=3635 RepID=A0ABM2ZNN7_GOSHI|nr:enoyl-CoA hydratase 2, peroxisomal-like [Gossypium hirsutum]
MDNCSTISDLKDLIVEKELNCAEDPLERSLTSDPPIDEEEDEYLALLKANQMGYNPLIMPSKRTHASTQIVETQNKFHCEEAKVRYRSIFKNQQMHLERGFTLKESNYRDFMARIRQQRVEESEDLEEAEDDPTEIPPEQSIEVPNEAKPMEQEAKPDIKTSMFGAPPASPDLHFIFELWTSLSKREQSDSCKGNNDEAKDESNSEGSTNYAYTERDVAVYALGVGACGRDTVDIDELKYVYHENGQYFIKVILIHHLDVLPTFSTLFSLRGLPQLSGVPDLKFDKRLLLHGQQCIEIHKPLPSNASINNKTTIVGFHDKGKAAILELETRSYEKKYGEILTLNRTSVFLRGAGGFSDPSKPFTYSNYPVNLASAMKIPKTQPSVVFEDCTQPPQALLYRLSGDYNPLHSDPMIAKVTGFSRTILHGLCTLGFAIRAIIKCICMGDLDMVKSFFARFLLQVYPGEALITDLWLEGLRVIYQVTVKEMNQAVLSGYVDLHRLAASL